MSTNLKKMRQKNQTEPPPPPSPHLMFRRSLFRLNKRFDPVRLVWINKMINCVLACMGIGWVDGWHTEQLIQIKTLPHIQLSANIQNRLTDVLFCMWFEFVIGWHRKHTGQCDYVTVFSRKMCTPYHHQSLSTITWFDVVHCCWSWPLLLWHSP